jgi:CRISPR-associated endonuclease Cas2
MARKKKTEPLTFYQKLVKIKNAGLSHIRPPNRKDEAVEEIETLDDRISRIFELFNKHRNDPAKMIYFIMYDIENNKIRTQIAKYLKKKGCIRVQKSIFLASTERTVFNEIHKTIREVQEVYDNYDSIFFVPVSVDQLRAMKIVGQSFSYELITGSKNTLFF